MRRTLILFAICGLAACTDKPSTPPKREVLLKETLPHLPVPPGGELVSRSEGEDVLKLRFRTSSPPDSVAGFYRRLLGKPPWRLKGDTKANGTTTFYAEQNGPPLWVTIQAAGAGDAGSLVDLVGARTK